MQRRYYCPVCCLFSEAARHAGLSETIGFSSNEITKFYFLLVTNHALLEVGDSYSRLTSEAWGFQVRNCTTIYPLFSKSCCNTPRKWRHHHDSVHATSNLDGAIFNQHWNPWSYYISNTTWFSGKDFTTIPWAWLQVSPTKWVLLIDLNPLIISLPSVLPGGHHADGFSENALVVRSFFYSLCRSVNLAE